MWVEGFGFRGWGESRVQCVGCISKGLGVGVWGLGPRAILGARPPSDVSSYTKPRKSPSIRQYTYTTQYTTVYRITKYTTVYDDWGVVGYVPQPEEACFPGVGLRASGVWRGSRVHGCGLLASMRSRNPYPQTLNPNSQILDPTPYPNLNPNPTPSFKP